MPVQEKKHFGQEINLNFSIVLSPSPPGIFLNWIPWAEYPCHWDRNTCPIPSHTFLMSSLENELVAQLCLTLVRLHGCSPLGSSVHGIFQARILEWVATFFSRGSSRPRNRTQVSCTAGRCFTFWATREAQKKEYRQENKKQTIFY